MSIDQRKRELARPHGIVSQGCRNCAFFRTCGGIEPDGSLFDCFEHYCCGKRHDCDEVCPYNDDFMRRMNEVGGLRFGDVAQLSQSQVDLPRYVPLIHHGYSCRKPLNLPVVALDTYQVLRLRANRYGSIVEDSSDLRREFSLSDSTRIILRGTAKDRHLERYWTYRRRDDVPKQIAKLSVDFVVGPNYSHFLDVPRTDNLFNRKRQLICVTELAEQGICVVPHLSAVATGDWRFWQTYLRQNPSVKYVATEFQTGNKSPSEGVRVVRQLADLQNAVGRPLHPFVIGGTQFTADFAKQFIHFTVIDSYPFMKAVKRRLFDQSRKQGRWAETFTLKGQGIEEVISQNVQGHSAWIDNQVAKGERERRQSV